MSWLEAYALIEHLGSTPGTYLHMKLNDWDFPLSLTLRAQWEATEIAANANRAKGAKFETLYTRPEKTNKVQKVSGTPVSLEEAEQIYAL